MQNFTYRKPFMMPVRRNAWGFTFSASSTTREWEWASVFWR